MKKNNQKTSKHLIFQSLPKPNTKRWSKLKKIKIIKAINLGILTLDDACKKYCLSVEEYLSWQKKLF